MRELQRGRLGVALTQPKVGWEPDMVMRFIVGFLVDESGATSISVFEGEVELGDANDNFIVVSNGIAEDDEVLLWNPEAVEGSTASPAASAGKKNGKKGSGKGGSKKKDGKP